MQSLQRLLLGRLDLDQGEINAAGGFEQRVGVGELGLVASDVART